MIAAPQHEIKSADAILAEDVICQSFIQSSCTLAYACLLIRRGRFELATHVLHSLEAKQASRFKDMVFYLQAQIGIETGEYAMVKKRLVPRVNQHPNDMVAISLLETCIYREFAESEPDTAARVSDHLPAPGFGNAEAASAAALSASYASTELPPAEPAAPAMARPATPPAAPALEIPSYEYPTSGPWAVSPNPAAARSQTTLPSAPAAPAAPSPAPVAPPAPFATTAVPIAPRAPSPSSAVPDPGLPPGYVEIALASLPTPPAAAPGGDGSRGHRAGASGDADMGLYQGIAHDPNTQALGLWGGKSGAKSFCRAPEFEPLMAMLSRELPAAVQGACGALEGGPVHKICFSFQHLTISTFHAGAEGMAHVTGPLNQNLLSIVRAENTFKKAAAGGPSAMGGSVVPGAHA